MRSVRTAPFAAACCPPPAACRGRGEAPGDEGIDHGGAIAQLELGAPVTGQ